MFKRYIRKKINRLICEAVQGAEEAASFCAETYVKYDKYQEKNPYRGPSHGFLCGVNWLSNEITKKL